MKLHHIRRGAGEPLVLIHGLGGSIVVWEPVIDLLASERDVVALDLPGFGASPDPGGGFVPTAAELGEVVSALCAGLGIERPHLAGNSLGGWIALEIAAAGKAASVCAISPAGLWREPLGPRRRERYAIGQRVRPLVGLALRSRRARELILRSTLARPDRLTRAEAEALVGNYLDAPLYAAANEEMRMGAFERKDEVAVPVTLAWGELDRIVGRPSRSRRPPGARYLEMPGWGHTPTWDDPEGVAALILESSSAPAPAGSASAEAP
ncbi:MAG TPA: alpha/beta fold hydrolase [Solirubrobacterales bacterium]